MNLRNLKIGTRLAAGFGTLLALLAVVVLINTVLSNANRSRLNAGISGRQPERPSSSPR